MLKINENLNYLIIATSNGILKLYNLPDLIILDKINLNCKIQVFDIYLSYLIIATNNGINKIIDLSNKKLIELKIQDSGFKYPITTDLKIFNTINNINDLPHELIYAQTGLEGKVSIVTNKIESQTEPTVTINTAAKSAPISKSCIENLSGIIINNNEPKRFIFRAHRSNLNDNKIIIGPIYSLNIIDKLLITAGYGGDSSGSIEGSFCFWDINKKRRIKLCKGFPLSIVKTETWETIDINNNKTTRILVCGCSDDSFKNMPIPIPIPTINSVNNDISYCPSPSVITIVVLG
jgi:hypothetical protein